MKRLNKILLIDDDFATNYLHEIHLNKLNLANNIIKVLNGQEALDLLFKDKIEFPDLIFLDINMPQMDGWSFLEEYSKLASPEKCKIIMLTASINPKDKLKAEKHAYLFDFMSKPMTQDGLVDIFKSII